MSTAVDLLSLVLQSEWKGFYTGSDCTDKRKSRYTRSVLNSSISVFKILHVVTISTFYASPHECQSGNWLQDKSTWLAAYARPNLTSGANNRILFSAQWVCLFCTGPQFGRFQGRGWDASGEPWVPVKGPHLPLDFRTYSASLELFMGLNEWGHCKSVST